MSASMSARDVSCMRPIAVAQCDWTISMGRIGATTLRTASVFSTDKLLVASKTPPHRKPWEGHENSRLDGVRDALPAGRHFAGMGGCGEPVRQARARNPGASTDQPGCAGRKTDAHLLVLPALHGQAGRPWRKRRRTTDHRPDRSQPRRSALRRETRQGRTTDPGLERLLLGRQKQLCFFPGRRWGKRRYRLCRLQCRQRTEAAYGQHVRRTLPCAAMADTCQQTRHRSPHLAATVSLAHALPQQLSGTLLAAIGAGGLLETRTPDAGAGAGGAT